MADETNGPNARLGAHFNAVANDVFRKLNEAPESPSVPLDVKEVLRAILERALAALNSITLLINESQHDHAHDGAVLLRALYDVHLQTLYMLRDPVSRTRLFRDYLKVQVFELLRLADKNDSDIARDVSGSFLRPFFEQAVREDYANVRDQFQTNKGNRLQGNWYRGQLDGLAREVGMFPEYELMQRRLSNSVHSTPLGLFGGASVNDSILLHYAWIFVLRIIGGIVRYVGVPLDEVEQRTFDMATHSLCDHPPGMLPT